MPEIKITPAAREWCRRLLDPKRCTLVRGKTGSQHPHARGTASLRPPTMPMIRRLEGAGLITWETFNDKGWPFPMERAVLTKAGKAEAAKPDSGSAAIKNMLAQGCLGVPVPAMAVRHG